MTNMCPHCSQGIQQDVYSGFVWTLFTGLLENTCMQKPSPTKPLFFKNIFTNEKSPKNITLNYKIIIRNISFNLK